MRVETVGRIRENIEVAGEQCWTLFDTGSRNTYVTERVAALVPTFELERPGRVRSGGGVHTIRKDCRLAATIESRTVLVSALVLPEIGRDEEGKNIEILFGALALQQWGIVPVPHEERLDMSHYPDEWVEFTEVRR